MAEGWPSEVRGDGFLCHADFHLDDYWEQLAEVSGAQNDLVKLLGVPRPEEPFHVCLFARRESMRQHVARYFPQAPDRRALFVQQDGVGMVFAHWSNQLAVDLRHECTHAALHASHPFIPLWLDEGIAEYFEVDPGQRMSGSPYLKEVRWKARFAMGPNVARLEQLDSPNRMDSDDYRDSWACVHFMLHGPPAAREELKQYLSDLRDQRPTAPLGERLEQRFPHLSRQIASHFRNPKGWTNPLDSRETATLPSSLRR